MGDKSKMEGSKIVFDDIQAILEFQSSLVDNVSSNYEQSLIKMKLDNEKEIERIKLQSNIAIEKLEKSQELAIENCKVQLADIKSEREKRENEYRHNNKVLTCIMILMIMFIISIFTAGAVLLYGTTVVIETTGGSAYSTITSNSISDVNDTNISEQSNSIGNDAENNIDKLDSL